MSNMTSRKSKSTALLTVLVCHQFGPCINRGVTIEERVSCYLNGITPGLGAEGSMNGQETETADNDK
ncbi:hypothetical protein J2S00_000004 [Caldalkalibacillus uzonensis]|uniref:Secreted protein n=1 Tax=Caldalkalibacillus uzonensis TaxID=353224 RepID=A0ABU0CMY2_9BACI|nr:hypothetical protein [Caldalkalibacillus uzonensis]